MIDSSLPHDSRPRSPGHGRALSMGANQALHLATDHLDTFAYMAGFSGTMNGLSTDAARSCDRLQRSLQGWTRRSIRR